MATDFLQGKSFVSTIAFTVSGDLFSVANYMIASLVFLFRNDPAPERFVAALRSPASVTPLSINSYLTREGYSLI